MWRRFLHDPRLAVFRWHVVRHVARHRLLALLNVVSIALGIAVYLAVQISNDSANSAFAAGIDLVAGKAHLEIRGDIDEMLWPQIAKQPGIRSVTAVVEGVVTLPDFPGEYLRIAGIDLFTGEPFRTFELGRGGERVSLDDWIGAPGGIALSEEFARRLRLKIGDRFRVLANSAVHELTLVAMIDPRDSPAGTQPRFAVMDIGWAQELFARQGRLSSIEIQLDSPPRAAAMADALRAKTPADLAVEPPRQRSFQIGQMLSGFQLNLTALSMVSLFVGAFLIYNTVSASVARRRSEIGILRALGATRTQVRWLFLGEACLFGAVGVAAGAVLGVLLAQGLIGAVARAISSLYLLVSIDRQTVTASRLIVAAVLGFGAVLAGAWMPANEAARVDPVGALSRGAHAERALPRARRWHWLGLLFLGVAVAACWLALRVGPPWLGFVAAFCVLAGFAFFAPAVTLACGSAATAFARRLIVWRLGAENVCRSVHRNAITVAALAAAIAMTVGLTVMIFSFRRAVDGWIGRGVVADLFIAPGSNETIGLSAFVPPAALSWLEEQPQVAAVDTFREIGVAVLDSHGAPQRVLLAAIKGAYRHNMTFAGGGEERKMTRVFAGEAVAVTESFARKFRVHDGDQIALLTPKGRVEFQIAGIYSDYSRDQGVILIARPHFERDWDDPRVQSLAVYLKPGAAWEPIADEFRARFSAGGEFVVYSNRSLRQRILSIFDQTFALTYVMRTVAVLVAIVGIFLSVTTLVAERGRDIGVLRAIGASRGQIQRLFMTEAALIGAVATALGIAAGALLAMVLTWVVNPAFFGWTIALRFPWPSLIAMPLWIVSAAVLAAWYPAWRGAQTLIAAAVREE